MRAVHLRRLHRLANVLDAREHGGERDELRMKRIRHEPRERRLADAGRSPQDHRMEAMNRGHLRKQLARRQQMVLPGHLIECARAHPIGQGLRRRPPGMEKPLPFFAFASCHQMNLA
jgi:hypothetical protein